MQHMFDFVPIVLQWLRDTYLVDIATVSALAVSLWGIKKTYDQAHAAKLSADEATLAAGNVKEAVTNLKARLLDSTLQIDLTIALTMMEDIKTYQRNAVWGISVERYSRLRSLLNTIRSEYPQFTAAERRVLTKAISHFTIAEGTIDTALYQQTLPEEQRDLLLTFVDPVRLNKEMNEQMTLIEPILARVKARIGEEYGR